MHRELPNIGNPPRRALELEENNLLIQTAVSRIREPGDHWERNATILALSGFHNWSQDSGYLKDKI